MRYQGIDTAAPLSEENLKQLKANDISFVGRYLVPTSMWKAITADEIKRIHRAGLGVFLCWEINAGDMKYGASLGGEHGSKARQLAESYGVPAGTVIYFACDYNAQDKDFLAIHAYLQAAANALGNKYKIGLYGHNRVIDYMANTGIVTKFWQCVAWSNQVSKFTDIYQYQGDQGSQAKDLAFKVGVAVDLNSCEDLSAAGIWMPKAPWYEDDMKWVEKYHIMNDGRPNDPITRAEVAAMFRRYHYTFWPEDEKDLGGLTSGE